MIEATAGKVTWNKDNTVVTISPTPIKAVFVKDGNCFTCIAIHDQALCDKLRVWKQTGKRYRGCTKGCFKDVKEVKSVFHAGKEIRY